MLWGVAEDKKCNGKCKKPGFWVRDIFRKREQYGKYSRLVQELKTGDREFYFRCVYMLFILIAHLTPAISLFLSVLRRSPKSQTTVYKWVKSSFNDNN